MGVDKTGLDETGVDETSKYHKKVLLGDGYNLNTLPTNHHTLPLWAFTASGHEFHEVAVVEVGEV